MLKVLESIGHVLVPLQIIWTSYYVGVSASMPPKILYQSPERDVPFREGDRLELPCVAYGNPLPRYNWKMNGFNFDPSGVDGNVEMEHDGGTLIFHSIEAKHEGLYQCFADNGIGTAVSDIVNLRKAFIHNGPYMPVTFHKVYESFSLTLNCVPAWSYPSATVHWEIEHPNGSYSDVQLDKRVAMDLEGRLRFANVLPSDNQNGSIYSCVSTSPFLLTEVRGFQHRIEVTSSASQTFPVSLMWSSPSDMFALEGQNLTLKCIFSGNPTPDVYWWRDNFDPLDSKISLRSWGQEILIPHINQSDVGIYVCSGMNSESLTREIRQFTVRVQSRPKWINPPRDIEVQISQDAIINCTAQSIPPPIYKWLINGIDLQAMVNSPVLTKVELSEPSVLTIHNVDLSDQMNIQCNATNKHGYVFADVAINVSHDGLTTIGTHTSQPFVCLDRLGRECGNIMAAGLCNDNYVASFCQHTCDKCSDPGLVG